MPRLFVSHASTKADNAAVDALTAWLSERGHKDHFVDHRDIPGGASWNEELRREASRAEILILWVTRAWLASEECFAEYRASYYGDKTVLPLLVGSLRAQELDGAARRRFDTLCASVQGIPVEGAPPDGFVAEQIEAAIGRVARAARVARRQRAAAYVALAGCVLLVTVLALSVTHATYVGELVAKWRVDRSFAAAGATDVPFRDCGSPALCPEMVPLTGGPYAIGHADGLDAAEDEGLASQAPITPVEIPPFAISRHEVTKAQWHACAVSTLRAEDGEPHCRVLPFSESTAGEPVESISWNDAQAYVMWLNERLGYTGGPYRLPSEAEWEYAARGGERPRTVYSWGPSLGIRGPAPDRAVCRHANVLNAVMPVELDVRRRGVDCSGLGRDNHVLLAPVGSYDPNTFGLFDTAGNVSEWVADCWHDSHAARPVEIGAGPWIGQAPERCDRVLKGGSWIGFVDLLRPGARVRLSPDVRGFNIGLRVAREIAR